MISLNRQRLPLRALLLKIRLRQRGGHRVILATHYVQRPELAVVGNVFGCCVERSEGGRLQLRGVVCCEGWRKEIVERV